MMDTPDNYYAILGIPHDADNDTVKRAYRQLARRYHPDLAGPGGAVEMKRINRAYSILSDPEKRRQYDTVIGGVVDLRNGAVRTRPRPHTFNPEEDIEFSGLNIFSTRGPLRAGPVIHSSLGVITSLTSTLGVGSILLAAGSLNSNGMFWNIIDGKVGEPHSFSIDPSFTIESLRELRFSNAGTLIAGWGRLCLHIWDAYNGQRLWSYALTERAVSAYYSLDASVYVSADGKQQIGMALPLLTDDIRGPRAWGVRGTDIVTHEMEQNEASVSEPLVCLEEGRENRHFWAIRLRALSRDMRTLVTLSCAHLSKEEQEMAIVRRWDLTAKARLGGKLRPQIASSILVGRCSECSPPYAVTPDTNVIAFAFGGNQLRVCDTRSGTYSELGTGQMGSSARLAISPDGQLAAVAREDSEINEGVIDVWSVTTGQIIQKLYHPWPVSALHFAEKQLVVALTDGTIQIWE